ncbi:MAG: hypothetical protein QNK03_01705 [Myxococcota bacterium]|nr:hypothetical protein [Myxococcota bacterium]
MSGLARAVLVFGLLTAQGAHAAAPEIQALLREGVRLNFVGDRDGADAVWARLRREHPSHPAGQVGAVRTLFWRQIFDEENTRYDAAIESHAERAVALAEARLAIDPDDAEAHYYAGKALTQLGRILGVRGHYLRAGRLGELGRVHLERVLELEPEWVDALYPVGLYYYYADLVTRWFRWLRWLPFVPSGDGPTGRRYLNDVAERGDVNRDQARLILSNISTYHEPIDLPRAHALLSDLVTRYPENTLIRSDLIWVLIEWRRYKAAIEQALQLEAQEGRDELDRSRIAIGRLWRARAELMRGRAAHALTLLEVFGPDEPRSPSWGRPWLLLTRAQALDAEGERAAALALYQEVAELGALRHSRLAASLAEDGLRRPFAIPGVRPAGGD